MAKAGSEGQTRKTTAEWASDTKTYPEGHRLMDTDTGTVRISKGGSEGTYAQAWQSSGGGDVSLPISSDDVANDSNIAGGAGTLSTILDLLQTGIIQETTNRTNADEALSDRLEAVEEPYGQDILVAGAGTSAVNARFYRDGTFNDAPHFTKVGGTPGLDRCKWNGEDTWFLEIDGNAQYEGTGGTVEGPWTATWAVGVGEGSNPAPTVSRYPQPLQEVLDEKANSADLPLVYFATITTSDTVVVETTAYNQLGGTPAWVGGEGDGIATLTITGAFTADKTDCQATAAESGSNESAVNILRTGANTVVVKTYDKDGASAARTVNVRITVYP